MIIIDIVNRCGKVNEREGEKRVYMLKWARSVELARQFAIVWFV